MGGVFVVLFAYLFRQEISEWLSNAVSEGIRRSKKDS